MKPLVIAKCISIVFHEQMVLMHVFFAKSAMQIAVLEFAVKHKIIRVYWLFWLLVLKTFEFFERRACLIL